MRMFDGGFERKPEAELLIAESQIKNPPVVCLGRARVDNRWAYRFSLLTLCFQEYLQRLNPTSDKSCVRKL